MAKPRKNIPEKLRAKLQQEIGSACPICMNTDVDHFQVHHLDEDPSNNTPENLLMLCSICHSKITKGDISPTEAKGIKCTLINISKSGVQNKLPQSNTFYGNVNNLVIGSGNTVKFDQKKKTSKSKYPPGCIGYNFLQANYISYLIRRYHEFKEWDVGKENMQYGLFPSQLKKHFKIGSQRTINHLPEQRFDEVCLFVQQKILSTKLAKIKKDSQNFFQPFNEYVQDQTS